MERLDMTGQPCPAPAEKAGEALADPGTAAIQVLVDNRIAVQNLERMADGRGYDFAFRPFGEGAYLATVTKPAATAPAAPAPVPAPAAAAADACLTILVTKNGLGSGSKELAAALLKDFIRALAQTSPVPEAVVFLNGGALLTAAGSGSLNDLKALENKGCAVLTCGASAGFLGLGSKPAAGLYADMNAITARLAGAGRLVTV